MADFTLEQINANIAALSDPAVQSGIAEVMLQTDAGITRTRYHTPGDAAKALGYWRREKRRYEEQLAGYDSGPATVDFYGR